MHSRRILWTGVLPPHQGGAAVSGFQILVGLARRGHAIRSVAPITPESADAGRRFDAAHPALGVTRFPVPYAETSPHTPSSDTYRELEQTQIETALSSLIAHERPDVLILGRETFAWRAPSLAERHGVPCILRIAGGFLTGLVDGTYPAPLVSRWLDQARKVDLITAQTESVAAHLTALGLSRIRIIPNGVDLERFTPTAKDEHLRRQLDIRDDHIVVMHVSNLKPLKRALDIVESAASAVRQNERLLYVVVGDGVDRQPMELACRRHGITNHFRFVGWVAYDRVAAFLSLADMVVMTSESEAQARVYLEAQACERTLIASDIAGARHVIEDDETGLLFCKGDIADLTRTTLRAAVDAGLRSRLGANARKRVVTHSLDDVAAAYGEAVEDVIRHAAVTTAPRPD
jgi:glycosyltransferase involved in cell wall biosynthesis